MPTWSRPSSRCLSNSRWQVVGHGLSEEYEFVFDLLGRLEGNIIVRGLVLVRESTIHFGIIPLTLHPGKTVLILNILLYRLERELVTAVQFALDTYVVFKSDGVFQCRLTDSIDDELMLPDECWCLTDSNAYVVKR